VKNYIWIFELNAVEVEVSLCCKNRAEELQKTFWKEFYNLLRPKSTTVKNAPTKAEIENFWKESCGKNIQYNEEAYWIKNQCQKIEVWNGAHNLKRGYKGIVIDTK
jgi:hypothetical protein